MDQAQSLAVPLPGLSAGLQHQDWDRHEGLESTAGKRALAAYNLYTNLKGVSSTNLARDLSIMQKCAWHLAHRIRKTWEDGGDLFCGPGEFDETYAGGK